MTACVAGLRELGSKLIRWRIPRRWYLFALLPLGLYGLAFIVAALGDQSIRDSFTFGTGTILRLPSL